MIVVWRNPVAPVVREHTKCGVCGVMGGWFGGVEFGVGWTVAAYDYIFGICSDKCAQKEQQEKLVLKTKIELTKAYATDHGEMPAFVKNWLKQWEKQLNS
jgi:hypothetical protein